MRFEDVTIKPFLWADFINVEIINDKVTPHQTYLLYIGKHGKISWVNVKQEGLKSHSTEREEIALRIHNSIFKSEKFHLSPYFYKSVGQGLTNY